MRKFHRISVEAVLQGGNVFFLNITMKILYRNSAALLNYLKNITARVIYFILLKESPLSLVLSQKAGTLPMPMKAASNYYLIFYSDYRMQS